MTGRLSLACLALALLLGACAGQRRDDGAAEGRREAERLRGEVAELRTQVELARRASVEHADLGVRELRTELQAVQGVLEAGLRDVEQRQREQTAAHQASLQALEARVAELSRLPRGQETLPQSGAARSPSPEAIPNPPSGVAGPPPAEQLLARGLESFKRGERGQAVLELSDLLRAYPADPLAATAQFWIGEAFYEVRDWERASADYRRAVELAPRGKDAPQALFKLGLAQRALKRESRAREVWAQLIRDFPRSEAAQQARRALGER